MARQFLLLFIGLALSGCHQPDWLAARKARAAADAAKGHSIELSGREAKVLSMGNRESFDYAILAWRAFVLTDPPVSGLVQSSQSITWHLAEDPRHPTTVKLVAAKNDETVDGLLRTLRNELAGLAWTPLKIACFEGGAFQAIGEGQHRYLRWETADTTGRSDLPIVVARFWLVHAATD